VSNQVEIRVLGRLWVRTANGRVVPAAQWTTARTTDLLRLLAVHAGHMVPTSTLTANLWPGVETPRANASLRTATAQIRKALGRTSVSSQAGGLQLDGCWVDSVAHHSLAVEAGIAMRIRDFPRVVAAAKQADALYVDDFRAADDQAEWASEIREGLRTERKLMLADAAEAALELGWMRDAIALSTLAINLDSCFERAHRALMRAYAGIGEIDSALRTFERCHRNLSSELGAVPSAQTHALRQQLMSTEPSKAPFFAYVGRDAAVIALADAIRICANGDGKGVVCLSGAPGSGRESLLQAAVERLPNAHLRPVRPPNVSRRNPAREMTQASRHTDIAVMGPLDFPPARAQEAMSELLAAIEPQPGRVLVLITSPEASALLADDQTGERYRVHEVASPAMVDSDLRALAETLLAGPPSPELMTALASRSSGLAGAAVELLRAWISTGQIISTARGLDLTDEAPASTALSAASATFRLLAEQLEPSDLEMCQILAVLDQPATAADVMATLGTERRTERRRLQIEERLDVLAARGILSTVDGAYVFHDRATQDLFELWLRPSLRERIVQLRDDRQRVPETTVEAPPFLADRRAGIPGRRASDYVSPVNGSAEVASTAGDSPAPVAHHG